MRFLAGCTEICGLIKVYSEELQKQGHEVISIADKHPFYNYTYTYPYSTLTYDYFKKKGRTGLFLKLFFRLSEWIEEKIPDFRNTLILLLLLRKFDTYIYLWNGVLPDQKIFRFLKFFRKKIIVLFVGDEVRHFIAFSQEYDVSSWQFPAHYAGKALGPQLFKLRYAERYADIIYSVPDQMGYATRGYNHLHIPVNTSDYVFKNNKRRVPRVVHLPSEPFIKGSDLIMKVMEELKAEGLEFELVYKSKIPHEEVKQLLSDADILVDELITHGPGVLAFEAMASGCAVATCFLEEYADVFNPPVCAITKDSIKEKVRELIVNFDYRQDLIVKGYEYVSLHNNTAAIVRDFIAQLKKEQVSGEYQPAFYQKKFIKPKALAEVFDKADAIYFKKLS